MTMTAKYAGTCKACRHSFPAGAMIEWSRANGARHLDLAGCAAATEAAGAHPAPPAVTLNASPIATFLTAARDRGLKFPKVRFLAPGGGELRLSLAGSLSKFPGSVQVKIDSEWIGRVEPTGNVAGPLRTRTDVLAALMRIAGDPAAAAKEYGALTCRCSFCNLGLTDGGSVEVGYGPVCAKNYGLPHRPQGTPVVAAVPTAILQLAEVA